MPWSCKLQILTDLLITENIKIEQTGHCRREKKQEVDSTYSAQFATADEDSTFIKHTSVQMKHVIDIYCYKVLCQVSLQGSNTIRETRELVVRVKTSGPWFSMNGINCGSSHKTQYCTESIQQLFHLKSAKQRCIILNLGK